MAPVSASFIVCRKIGQMQLCFYTIKRFRSFYSTLICTGTRAFECNEYFIFPFNGCISYLYVSVKYHPAWPPIFCCVWPYIAIHEGAIGLPYKEPSKLTIKIPRTYSCLAFICPGTP